MSEIEDMWRSDYRLPAGDGLYLADGTSYRTILDPAAPRGFRILEPLALGESKTDEPENVSYVDGLVERELDDGTLLWGGEGSYGSQGFAARLKADKSLTWALFFEESNPFSEIRLSGRDAIFLSTSGVIVRVNIDAPGGAVL